MLAESGDVRLYGIDASVSVECMCVCVGHVGVECKGICVGSMVDYCA